MPLERLDGPQVEGRQRAPAAVGRVLATRERATYDGAIEPAPTRP